MLASTIIGVTVVQQLYFGMRVLNSERDVVGLDVFDVHIVLHDLASDHDGLGFFKAEQGEEALRRFNIAYDDSDMMESLDHAASS
jgi:hypothetical protein